ncbi:MAG: PilZ domain-containing protein [Desulfobacteraceae bacterium]
MIMQKENREYERYEHQSPLMIYPKGSSEYYYGLSCNYSRGGMYLKTDGDLDAEEYYTIKMLNYDHTSPGPEKYQEYQGLVRWAQLPETSTSSDSSYYYGYGVEFTRPVEY